MKQKVVAERYAEALFEVASEQRQESKYSGILKDIVKMFQEHPDFERLLLHPVVSSEDKKQMLRDIFTGKVPDEMLAFLCLLVDKQRENYLPEIADEFERLLRALNQTVVTEVTTAFKLEDTTKEVLSKELSDYLNQKVEIQYSTDPELLGGVTIKIGDRMIDGSLRTQLGQMAQALV